MSSLHHFRLRKAIRNKQLNTQIEVKIRIGVILLYINPSIYYNFNIMLIKFDENTEDYSEASF